MTAIVEGIELREGSKERDRILELAERHLCPARVRLLRGAGLPLVIGRREGYRIFGLDGHELIDVHLNGGTFNLGHRHPEVVEALERALATLDIGNHHFPSFARAELAARLAEHTPGDLTYTIFAASGGEAIDVAIKTARHATKRRKIVSIEKGFHGHTGLALAAGDARFSKFFLSEAPAEEFVQVPFNDLAAMEKALAGGDVAAVLIETIPATFGFPLPDPGYLASVAEMCRQHGTLYVADEVQTGLGRTGALWGVERFGVEPDILVTAKGLSGGIYPIAATVVSARAAGWLHEDGWAHLSTYGGAELGCVVAARVLEICTRPSLLANVRAIGERFGAGLEAIRSRNEGFFLEIRRCGLVMGLRFSHPEGGLHMTRALYRAGVWAMFAGHDPSVLQFKPGLLVDEALCDEILDRFEQALLRCRAELE